MTPTAQSHHAENGRYENGRYEDGHRDGLLRLMEYTSGFF